MGWNNGDLSTLPVPLNRHRHDKTYPTVSGSPRKLLGVRCDGWTPEPAPVGAHGHAVWTDPGFSADVFGIDAPTTWTVSFVDDTRLDACFFVHDRIAGMLEIAGQPGGSLHATVTCAALVADTNDMLDEACAESIERFLDRLVGALTAVAPSVSFVGERAPAVWVAASTHIDLQPSEMTGITGDAFLLACPVAELDWIEDWFFDLRASDSGHNEQHCIFVEAMTAPFLHATKGKTTWYTVEFDRQARRFHAVVDAGGTLAHFVFTISDLDGGRARMRWDCDIASVDDHGRALLLESGMQRRLEQMLVALRTALAYYVRTGDLYHQPAHRRARLITSRLCLRLRRHVSNTLPST